MKSQILLVIATLCGSSADHVKQLANTGLIDALAKILEQNRNNNNNHNNDSNNQDNNDTATTNTNTLTSNDKKKDHSSTTSALFALGAVVHADVALRNAVLHKELDKTVISIASVALSSTQSTNNNNTNNSNNNNDNDDDNQINNNNEDRKSDEKEQLADSALCTLYGCLAGSPSPSPEVLWVCIFDVVRYIFIFHLFLFFALPLASVAIVTTGIDKCQSRHCCRCLCFVDTVSPRSKRTSTFLFLFVFFLICILQSIE